MAADFYQQFVPLRSHGPGREWLVDPSLRPRMVAEAAERGTNLTEVAIGILGPAFRWEGEAPAERKTSPKESTEELNIRLPYPLHEKIELRAARTKSKSGRKVMANDLIRATLSAHYGLRVPPKPTHKRRPRRPAQPTA